MIDTLLFDFDGTLMDTNEAVIASWQHVFRTLEGRERPVSEIISTLGEPIVNTVERILPRRDMREVIDTYRDFHYANYEGMISLFPGVRKMLVDLKALDMKLAVVTNRMRNTTLRGLEKYGLESYFDAIICCNEAEKNKPEPEPAWLALKELNSTPEQAFFIGDSQNDILCGYNAGIKTVRVAWAVATDESHGEDAAVPDYIIETPKDLTDLLIKLNAQS